MMKKILFMMGLMVLTVLSSCKKDDDNSDLIGTWAENPSIEQVTFTFGSNGQAILQVKNCDTNTIIRAEVHMYVFDSKTNGITFSSFDINPAYVKFIGKTSIRLYQDAAYGDAWSEEMYKQ